MEDNDTYTRIRITKVLREKLGSLGKKGDTYEDIIWHLIGEEKDGS